MEHEVEIDESDVEGIHPETLEEKTPSFIVSGLSLVTEIFSGYGWIILFGSIIGYLVWRSWSTKYDKWKELAEYHKNPDKFIDRENSLQTVRQRMQEEYEQKAREHAEKLKEEQERRRAAAITNPPKVAVCKADDDDKKKTKSLRTGFNPLMSDTRSSCSFRPGRRSGGG